MKRQKRFLGIFGLQILLLLLVLLISTILFDPLLDRIVTLKTETEIFESALPQIDPHNESQVSELHSALSKKERVQDAYFSLFFFSIILGIALTIPLALCNAGQFYIQKKTHFWKLAGIHFGLSLAGILLLIMAFWLLGRTAGMELVTIPIFVIALIVILLTITSLQIYALKKISLKKHFMKYRLQTILGSLGLFVIWSTTLLLDSPQKYLIQGFGLVILGILVILLLVREKCF
jgi:drug/metabolite transporter (DMT)-like permease